MLKLQFVIYSPPLKRQLVDQFFSNQCLGFASQRILLPSLTMSFIAKELLLDMFSMSILILSLLVFGEIFQYVYVSMVRFHSLKFIPPNCYYPFYKKFLLDQDPFGGVTGILCFGIRMTLLPMGFKASVDSWSSVLFGYLHAMIP